jgi:hypothetical protein
MEDHEHHVHLILNKFKEISLYNKLEKCEFHQIEVELLGCIISKDGIRMDPYKVQTNIVGWATLAFVCDFQCLFIFTNFFQHFIPYYSMIMTPLTCLTQKDQPFV